MADFRSKRSKLPPEAFAIAPEVEPEPSDPIDEETWTDLVHLPDDVSIRTSDFHGTLLKQANDAWGLVGQPCAGRSVTGGSPQR
jgi:hypothetical protein